MAIVGFDMMFQFVCAGFEGSANDQKVLSDVLQNRGIYNLQVPEGKYFLVDAGYGNRRGFIGPYRGTRYHLKEFGAQALAPRTASELFNLRHAKLRNVIERTFGLWKERFPILTHIPRNYPIKTQVKIVNACAVLHNFIMKRSPSTDELYEHHRHERIFIDDEDNDDRQDEANNEASDSQYAYRLREAMALEMWDANANRRAR
eukprot:TRINITY_DN7919_c0_g3_i5.p1 TRINITY_DN7919_c0_g3~~TRINITY_DN7919_c0_g3_i5.p1  ORF type:complete len:203 (-),score=33.88 TRINITY_DN7919_c0_g3_i5:273-881(-)